MTPQELIEKKIITKYECSENLINNIDDEYSFAIVHMKFNYRETRELFSTRS